MKMTFQKMTTTKDYLCSDCQEPGVQWVNWRCFNRNSGHDVLIRYLCDHCHAKRHDRLKPFKEARLGDSDPIRNL